MLKLIYLNRRCLFWRASTIIYFKIFILLAVLLFLFLRKNLHSDAEQIWYSEADEVHRGDNSSQEGWKNAEQKNAVQKNTEQNNAEQKNTAQKNKIILIWSPKGRWKKNDWSQIFSRMIQGKCPQNCKVTYDRSQKTSADAIVFYDVDLFPLPSVHPDKQVWVLFNMEAPTHDTWAFPGRNRDVFDWTMTYHTESDVVAPYGRLIRLKQMDEPLDDYHDRDYWAEKKEEKFASWMVSNCASHSKREDFVKEFQRYENVDIYGGCGRLKCGIRTIVQKLVNGQARGNCYKLMSSYKFYFALENSLCKDYITEKFFKALQMDAIPVVFGGGNYSSLAPNHSFINARDFESPKALALYLRTVANNASLYNSYFKWKKEFAVEAGFPFSPFVCDLCSKLHGKPLQFSKERNSANRTKKGRYSDVIQWFAGVSDCER